MLLVPHLFHCSHPSSSRDNCGERQIFHAHGTIRLGRFASHLAQESERLAERMSVMTSLKNDPLCLTFGITSIGCKEVQSNDARDAIVVGDDDVGPQMNSPRVLNAAAVEDWENLQWRGPRGKCNFPALSQVSRPRPRCLSKPAAAAPATPKLSACRQTLLNSLRRPPCAQKLILKLWMTSLG